MSNGSRAAIVRATIDVNDHNNMLNISKRTCHKNSVNHGRAYTPESQVCCARRLTRHADQLRGEDTSPWIFYAKNASCTHYIPDSGCLWGMTAAEKLPSDAGILPCATLGFVRWEMEDRVPRHNIDEHTLLIAHLRLLLSL